MTDFTLDQPLPTDRLVSPAYAATRAERIALRVLQLGALAAVLTVSTYRVFELDRFFVPKEVVLHLTSAVAAFFVVRSFGRTDFRKIDLLLVAFLLLGAASTVFATNPWAAGRALAISVSSVALFWIARALRNAGLGGPLLVAIGIAVTLAAATSLAQAYGLRLDIFSVNRAPGGTLGNRNFVGHVAAFGLPVLLYAVLMARNAARFLAGSIGIAATSAALVLTRSRGAWLAAAVVGAVVIAAMIGSPGLRSDRRTWGRLLLILLFAGGAVAAALTIPNTLRWRSDNPYLESVQGIAAFDEGSGRGRLIQYERSLVMTASHPLLGVGPGNWPVVYPEYAARRDPSMNPSEPGMTYNPWPSSDWIAYIAERGPLAAAVLGLVLFTLALGGLRRLVTAQDRDTGLLAMARVGIIAGAVVAGAFDAVLLLAVPAILFWPALGALLPEAPRDLAPRSRVAPAFLMFVIAIAAAIGGAKSIGQVMAMDLYAVRGDRASLRTAAMLDPGSYRVHLRLARGGKRTERCEHAIAARDLYPSSRAAKSSASGCK